MRPNSLLRRAQSHSKQGGLSSLLHSSRGTSPQRQGDLISGFKLVEEEDQPNYKSDQWYPAKLGEVLHHRYELCAKLGFGMTATVWLAKDLQA